jgi:hypothetical protein
MELTRGAHAGVDAVRPDHEFGLELVRSSAGAVHVEVTVRGHAHHPMAVPELDATVRADCVEQDPGEPAAGQDQRMIQPIAEVRKGNVRDDTPIDGEDGTAKLEAHLAERFRET